MFKIGQRVRFTDDNKHEATPWWYPHVGCIGVIIEANDDKVALVDWGEGSGVEKCSDGYRWWASFDKLEAVDAEG